MPEPIRLHHLKVLKNPLKILELASKIQNTSMDEKAIAIAKFYEAKARLLIGALFLFSDLLSIRALQRQMSSQWALVTYRNFSKVQKLTPEDAALSGFESEIEVLKCISDLHKNQKLDSDFIEGSAHKISKIQKLHLMKKFHVPTKGVILKSPDLKYKINSLKRLKKYQTALKLAEQVIEH